MCYILEYVSWVVASASEAENAYSSGTPGSAFLTMRITV